MASLEIVAGWTDPIDAYLLSDGERVDLTGLTSDDVELILVDRHGTLVDAGGDVAIVDAAEGLVRYLPDAGDFTAEGSPYKARWKVTSLSDRISYFPSSVDWDTWKVGRSS